ncbi:tRNA nucleotidyltransferase [Moraxella canis]|uniref:tRNA nucleotidyltransferase n=1 Tax=Moraxella canis TaxID=90239 RepID=A0ABZ0WWB8_9GAMM|nr:tRNA nucleotidyltransferase [Moraxella canis]WQE03558.1 tRNA nucleotidyltransferase [Moraxella canis]
MQVYLVGGAVRDGVLGLPVKDKDFMVVGATPQMLLDLGFIQVGADFPVFLHPKTQTEYALARIERKSGTGHTAFKVHADPSVSLEEDLIRRDLTINALAIEVKDLFDDTPMTGEVLDFYGGLKDVQDRTLRHVSPAFSEDPLRVLRVARFFARFAPLGFSIHDSTAALMQTIASSGEMSSLSRERLYSEFARALMENQGDQFIRCLHDLDILSSVLPALSQHFINFDNYQAAMTRLTKACQLNLPLASRLAVLLNNLPATDVADCLTRLNAPKHICQFVTAFQNLHDALIALPAIDSKALLTLIERTQAHKDSAQFIQLYDTCHAHQGSPLTYPKQWLFDAIARYQSVTIADIDPALTGKAIGDELSRLRAQALHGLLGNFQTASALTDF